GQRRRRKAEVGRDGCADGAAVSETLLEEIGDGLESVVGNGNCADAQGAEHEVAVRSGGASRQRKAKLVRRRILQRPEGPGGGVDARSRLAGDDGGAAAMIAVVVQEAGVGETELLQA